MMRKDQDKRPTAAQLLQLPELQASIQAALRKAAVISPGYMLPSPTVSSQVALDRGPQHSSWRQALLPGKGRRRMRSWPAPAPSPGAGRGARPRRPRGPCAA
jgi:hypothetical protein